MSHFPDSSIGNSKSYGSSSISSEQELVYQTAEQPQVANETLPDRYEILLVCFLGNHQTATR